MGMAWDAERSATLARWVGGVGSADLVSSDAILALFRSSGSIWSLSELVPHQSQTSPRALTSRKETRARSCRESSSSLSIVMCLRILEITGKE
jgi:hypothetical protein